MRIVLLLAVLMLGCGRNDIEYCNAQMFKYVELIESIEKAQSHTSDGKANFLLERRKHKYIQKKHYWKMRSQSLNNQYFIEN